MTVHEKKPGRRPGTASPLPPNEPATAKAKMAERIAAELEQRLLQAKAAVGDRLGREADLAVEYGVSRWVMREALAQLMHAGAIEARRGGNGGLYVAAPAPEVVRNSVVACLESLRVDPHEIVSTRLELARVYVDKVVGGLQGKLARRMAALATQAEQGEGQEAVNALVALQAEMVRASGNPVLELLYNCFSDLLVHAAWLSSLDDQAFARTMETLRGDRQAMIKALLAGDGPQALALEAEFGQVFETVYRSSALLTGRGLPQARMRAQTMFPGFRLTKKTEQVAWALREEIAAGGWTPGMNLGSEAELMARFEVGRATLREAVRSLERLGVVKMAHGGGGGLKVVSPDAANSIASARHYLHAIAPKPAMLREVREALARALSAHPGNRVAALFMRIVDAA